MYEYKHIKLFYSESLSFFLKDPQPSARLVDCRNSVRRLILGRPRGRWEDNIRMDFEEIGINAGNWVDSAQDRNYWRALVNVALKLRVP